jgi:hypothetical protein
MGYISTVKYLIICDKYTVNRLILFIKTINIANKSGMKYPK